MEFNISQIDLKQEAGGREKAYFGIVLLLIFVMFTRWLYVPKMKQTKLLQIDVKNNSMQIDTLKRFAQLKFPTLQTTSNERAMQTGTKFEKAVEASMRSQQQVVADIVRLLTSTDVLSGVSLAGMSFGAEINKDTYGSIPVAIDMEGKYAGLLRYLGEVERFGKLVTVDNVELTAKENSPFIVRAKLSASIYVVHPQGAPMPASAGEQTAAPAQVPPPQR